MEKRQRVDERQHQGMGQPMAEWSWGNAE